MIAGTAPVRRRLLVTSLIGAALVAAGILIAEGWRNAIADPIVRRLTVRVPDWRFPRPVTIVFFSDVHVHGPDMPPSRLAGIVRTINDLHPDIVISAGDFVGGNFVGGHNPVT